MRPATKVFWGCVAVMGLAMAVVARADVTDETTRQQLLALKKLCDEGLVSPEVCREKQRDILGLLPRVSGPPARSSAPSPGRSIPAASRPEASNLPPRAGTEQKENDLAPTRRENTGALPEGGQESPLGFRMQLPAGWLRADPQEVQQGIALMKKQIADSPETKRLWDRVADNVQIYLKEGDQLSIQAHAGAMPQNALDSKKLCRQWSSSMDKLASRPLTMYECGLGKTAGATTLYLEHDGLISGMRTLQFWLEQGPRRMIRFTLNCKDENVDIRRKELKEIIASVHW